MSLTHKSSRPFVGKSLSAQFAKSLAALFVVLFATLSVQAQAVKCEQYFSQDGSGGRVAIQNAFIKSNHFTVSRTLGIYSHHFPFKTTESLQDTVKKLPYESVWVDMGAGEARALIDGLKANPNIASGIGIAYKKPGTALTGEEVPGRFHYLDGDYVENMDRDGKLSNIKGQVNLVTDVFGPVSYSEHLPQLLQTYFDLLQVDGIAVFNVMAERNFVSTPGGQVALLNIPLTLNGVSVNGKLAKDGIVTWLKTIPGIEVIEVAELTNSSGPYFEKSIGIKIKKVSRDVIVPATLKTTSYEASNPPIRTFEVIPAKARDNVIPLRTKPYTDQAIINLGKAK